LDGTPPYCNGEWIDNQAICAGGYSTIHLEGSITNPQGEVRPLYGDTPHAPPGTDITRAIYVDPGDRIRMRFVAKVNSNPASLEKETVLHHDEEMILSFRFEEYFDPESGFEVLVNGHAARFDGNSPINDIPIGYLSGGGEATVVEFEVPINAESGYDNRFVLKPTGSVNNAPKRVYIKSCRVPQTSETCYMCFSSSNFGLFIS
jgi:hypothetical protein